MTSTQQADHAEGRNAGATAALAHVLMAVIDHLADQAEIDGIVQDGGVIRRVLAERAKLHAEDMVQAYREGSNAFLGGLLEGSVETISKITRESWPAKKPE